MGLEPTEELQVDKPSVIKLHTTGTIGYDTNYVSTHELCTAVSPH